MSDYVVSARKYRPDSFSSLIGQDNIAQTLKNSIVRGQLAHAYLFCGPRGVGKTSAARIFAKTINCSSVTSDMEPCGECESCQSFKEGRSYCIHELDAASNNGVEDIKALMEQVQIPPQVGRYSVYIIDEVHMLSQAAFNAFLKTLEEPPAHAIFILCTTEKHKIIPTILSRCQTYDFNRIGIGDIVRNLRSIADKESVKIDEESLHVIARKADGAMRDALTIFDQTVAFCGTDVKYADVIRNLNVLDSEYGFNMVDAFLRKDYAAALLTLDEILSKGFNAQHFISDLGEHLRNLLVARTGGMESLLDVPDSLRERYSRQAASCTVKFIYDALGIIRECDAAYRGATNQRLLIEFSLMKLSFISGVPESATAVPVQPVVSDVAPAPKPDSPAPVKVSAAPEVPASPAPASVEAAAPAGTAAPDSPASQPETAPEVPAVTAPAASPAPASTPTPRTRTAGKAPVMSFAELMSDEEEVIDVGSGKSDDPIPDESLLSEKWKNVAEGVSDPRLVSTLMNVKLEFRDEEGMKVVTMFVVNDAQKKWIDAKHRSELEARYRNLVGSSKLRLDVAVTPSEQVEAKPYMPGDKARDLMSKNENVREFIADLGLDI